MKRSSLQLDWIKVNSVKEAEIMITELWDSDFSQSNLCMPQSWLNLMHPVELAQEKFLFLVEAQLLLCSLKSQIELTDDLPHATKRNPS